jgi:hypothetical protein
MKSLTLHIPKRARETDDYTIEAYRWKDGEINSAYSARTILRKTLFAAGGTLDIQRTRALILEEEGDSEDFAVCGRELYTAIHNSEVAELWDDERTRAASEIDNWTALTPAEQKNSPEPDALRVYFSIQDKTLAAFPWELIRSPAFPLFLDKEWPLLRCESRKLAPRQDVNVWPIRILVIDAFASHEAQTFGSTKEVEAIRMALRPFNHFFDLEVLQTRDLDRCTAETLRATLSQFRPHIFHFIGHGSSTGNDGHLTFSDSVNEGQDWSAAEIALAIKGMGSVLRLAFVNACRSGVPSDSDAYSVSQAFFSAGALGVIAMQADVRGETAAKCSERFYSELAKGKTIDKAISAARNTLSGDLGTQKRHPYVPVLTVRVQPEQILACPGRSNGFAVIASELDKVKDIFLDRKPERRATINTLFDTGLEIERRSAVVISGAQQIGKTWMIKWFLHACASNGTRVHCHETFAEKDWLGVLLRFCKGSNPSDSFTEPLPEAARRRFYNSLGQLVNKRISASSHPVITLKHLTRRNDAQDKVMKAFHDALKQAAGSGEIVIALDHLREGDKGLPNAHFRSLQEYLWERIAREPNGPVKVVVILPGLDKDRYETDFSSDLWKIIDLEKFPSTEVPRLMRQLALLKYPEKLPIFDLLSRVPWDPHSPFELVDFCNKFASRTRVDP